MHEYIVAIDVGSSNIYGAVGKIDNRGELNIIGTNSVNCTGLKKGVVVDIESAAKSIKNCIENLERIVDLEITSVFLSLPGGICELIWNKAVVAVSSENREIREKDLIRVLDATKIISIPSGKEIVGLIPQQYIVDGYENINEPIGMSGLRLELDAQVILAQTMVLSNLRKSLERAGVTIIAEVLSSQSISNIALKNIDKNLSTLIIDIGGETTDLALFKNKNLVYTSTIVVGGNNITKDISICLKIPHSSAEQLKIKYGQVYLKSDEENKKISVIDGNNNKKEIDKRFLDNIIEARVGEIFKLIKEQLKDKVVYDDISNVILVGGGVALFKDIDLYASDVLEKSVQVGYPEDFGASNPKYSNVVGTIKDIFETLKMTKNLNENSKKDNAKKVGMDIDEKKEGIISRVKEFISDFF
ncbi:cell division protein FtsA [Clostridium grantii]|uniref:Cell division protein FtsA n=1 Tax=Clostridium grantii DSM 8605 TaxID=1121316 RepID=A0A1M5QRK3_9CLOT|nr:cell division protein FtsA [Clostridium grantii]SHH16765.1 cell division protein FtsA [Clostridium grantii DSM 8605]